MKLLPAPKPPVHAPDPSFLAFLRSRPCLICGTRGCGFNRVEAAHLDSRRYGDAANAVPLHGSTCHREGRESFHQLGREGFERRWKVDLEREAEKLYLLYLATHEERAF